MKSVPLTAFPRTLVRRTAAKKLRDSGRVPATIYGRLAAPQNLEVDNKALSDLIKHAVSETVLVDLTVEKDARAKRLALVQEVQHHPLSGQVLHIDFHEIKEDEKVTVHVPVEAIGEAVGVKTGGGMLEHVLHKLKVRCLPKDIPEVINVDVSALEIGRAVHIGEVPAVAGVEILGDKSAPVFAVAAPVTEEQEAAAAAAAPAGEVEMIKEKKEDGTEGAAPAKAGDKAAAKPGDKAAAPAAAGKDDKKPAAEKKK